MISCYFSTFVSVDFNSSISGLIKLDEDPYLLPPLPTSSWGSPPSSLERILLYELRLVRTCILELRAVD